MNHWKHNIHRIRSSGPDAPKPGGGFLGNILRLIGLSILLVLGFMFSIVAFIVLAIGAGVVWCYFLWKTREIRRQLREQPQGFRPPPETGGVEGNIIEGEVIRETEFREINPLDSRSNQNEAK